MVKTKCNTVIHLEAVFIKNNVFDKQLSLGVEELLSFLTKALFAFQAVRPHLHPLREVLHHLHRSLAWDHALQGLFFLPV